MKKWIVCAIVVLWCWPARAEDKLVVLLDWFVNPDHGPLIVARKRGYFEEEGLDVQFIEPADPSAPPKLVAAGQGDIAVSYQPQLHLQHDQGLPLVRIGTLVASPLNALVVLEEGPIQTLADLKGRRVGYSVAGFDTIYLDIMLRSVGLDLDAVELINVNFALSPSLYAGRVDAVIGAFRNFELNQMDIEGRPGRAFYVEEHGVPIYDELILVARQDRLDDPAMSKFLRALERAVQVIINHPEATWRDFVAYKDGLDDELNRRAWRDTLRRFALRPAALDRGRYERFARFVHAQGLSSGVADIGDFTAVLPAQ